MKSSIASRVLLGCSSRDGRSDEFVFPREAVEASTTGGSQEVLGFRNRLEFARDVLNRSPYFKADFAKRFHPIVLRTACIFIVSKAFEALLRRLALPDAESVESVIASCNQYPYLRVLSGSRDEVVLELVDEAVSIEVLASELGEWIEPLLKQLCSEEQAAEWVTAHILAWTLADFAHQPDLRREMLELAPAQADNLIWSRAWRGEASLRSIGQAVHYLGWEVALVVLNAIDFTKMHLQELEALIGLRSSRYYLSIASQADRGEHPVLQWATTEYAGLRASEALAVAETLREGLWRSRSNGRARRRFIHTRANEKSREFDFIVLNCAGSLPGGPANGPDAWGHCRTQAIAAGRDSMTAVSDPDFSKIPFRTGDFSAIDALHSFKKALRASGLSLDAKRIMYARMQGYSREEAHSPLRMPKNRVSAAWRELNRKQGSFLRILLL